jgi:hypothetical protein
MMEEAYKNYKLKHNFQINQGIEILCQEEFIHSIKTDDEFAKTWDVKVEVRELSMEERCDEYIKRHPKETNDGVLNYKWIGDNLCTHKDYDKWNIPTRAISLTYNNRTEVRYE